MAEEKMFFDLALYKQGRIVLTRKALAAIITFLVACGGYVIRNEIALASCKQQINDLTKKTEGLFKPSPKYYCGPPCGVESEMKSGNTSSKP